MSSEAFGDHCSDATVDLFACIADLTCERLDARRSQAPPDNYPCKAADHNTRSACD